LEQGVIEGENPVFDPVATALRYTFQESGCLGMQPKVGGIFHLKLNTGKRPIANKYREGKMKRTLKRELKVREIAKRETIEISLLCGNQLSVQDGALSM
jgi:predicted molibdopterin-dependent oxidoreductase YjgC